MTSERGAARTAVVTGASSGTGAATARHLALAGFDVVVGARRLDRLREVAEPIGARAAMGALRHELLGRPVRVTEIDPGMVEIEFSTVCFGGDTERAARVDEGVTPLTADDVAECVTFAVTRPSHVDIDSMIVLARDQAGARAVHRDASEPPRP